MKTFFEYLYMYKNYLPLILSGVLNYNEIDQKYISNSILEACNGHIKTLIPKKLTWPLWLSKMKGEETRVRKDTQNKENNGLTYTIVQHFKKAIIPPSILANLTYFKIR